MDSIIEILKYCLPSGFIASLLTWLVNRKLYKARSVKEEHDIYKVMYENLQDTILTLQENYNDLNIKFSQVIRTLGKTPSCRYYTSCPIRDELPNYTRRGNNPRAERKDRIHRTVRSDAEHDCDTKVRGPDGDTDGEPP